MSIRHAYPVKYGVPLGAYGIPTVETVLMNCVAPAIPIAIVCSAYLGLRSCLVFVSAWMG